MTKPESHPLNDPGEFRQPRYLGETVRPKSGESYDWHTHGFGQLISAASGSMFVGTPNRVLLLSPALALWIPPNVEYWMRYGSNNEMRYVDVRQDEAEKVGAHCRVLAMTPLLSALISGTMPHSGAVRAREHEDAFHDLLCHELAAAPDVQLSIAMPQDHRIRRCAQAALDDPGIVESVGAWLSEAPASRKTIERLFVVETGMPPSKIGPHAAFGSEVARSTDGPGRRAWIGSLGQEIRRRYGSGLDLAGQDH